MPRGRVRNLGLSPIERAACQALYELWDEHGHGPTLAELAHRLGQERPGYLSGVLSIAEAKGYTTREFGRPRSWRVTNKFLAEFRLGSGQELRSDAPELGNHTA